MIRRAAGSSAARWNEKGLERVMGIKPGSFYSLRHTTMSLLKNAGVGDVVARDILDRESEAISRSYTHIEAETKRAALAKLPDVTAR